MKIRLQTKTTLTIALLVVLVLTASSYLFYDTAKRALDAEMGERLVAVAKTSAAQLNGLNGSYLRALQPGDEGTRICTGGCKSSYSLCAMLPKRGRCT